MENMFETLKDLPEAPKPANLNVFEGGERKSSVYIPSTKADFRFYVLSMEDSSKKDSGFATKLLKFGDNIGSFMWNFFLPTLMLTVIGLIVMELVNPGTIMKLHDAYWKLFDYK